MIEDASLAAVMAEQGGTLIADYGSRQLWGIPVRTMSPVSGKGSVGAVREEDAIELHAGRLEHPYRQRNQFLAGSVPEPGKRLHLVQFAGPIKPEWRRELLAQGWRILSYIPQNAYLLYGDSASVLELRREFPGKAHLQWHGPYQSHLKAHPRTRSRAHFQQPGQPPDDLFAIQLVEDAAINRQTLSLLARFAREIVRETRALEFVNLVARVPLDRLEELAAQPDVVSIHPYHRPSRRDERQGQILAGNVGSAFGPGYLEWLTSKGFAPHQFTNFVVDITDSGIDNGTLYPAHPGLRHLGDPSNSGRVVYNRLIGSANMGTTLEGCDGHGTLNAHILAGYSALSGFPYSDDAGFRYGLGIAPFVKLGSSVIFDPSDFTNPNYVELISRAYQDGARISSNSWGSDDEGIYSIDSQIYDMLVRDAQPSTAPVDAPGNQEMVIVFSAGNSGPVANSVGSPGTAKNVICVGASENVHPHSSSSGGGAQDGADGCGLTDTSADNPMDVASFSARGPCDDGRTKPDIMAPGSHVTGGVAQQSNAGALGTALACFDAEGVCALAGSGTVGSLNNFFPLGQQLYTTSSGTSHSCPAVAGAAALIRQHFGNRGWLPPSPAMTKAWLLNSASHMTGVGANDTLPSNSQGMGLMSLGRAFDEAGRYRRDQLEEDRFTASGQTREFAGVIADSSKPLRVTLVWTDAPGSTAGSAYNNNLDLVVEVNGQTFYGNRFVGGLSATGGGPDIRNNVESVFLPAGVSGPFKVQVNAVNINSDGVPGNADPLDQDFALVVYNQAIDPVDIRPAKATILQEGCFPPNGVADPGEVVTLELLLENRGIAVSGPLVGSLLAINGVVPLSGPQEYGSLSPQDSPVGRTFTLKSLGSCGGVVELVLLLSDGSKDYRVVFPLNLGTVKTNEMSFERVLSAPLRLDSPNGVVEAPPIEVVGMPGGLQHIEVTLSNLSHTWPDDLDILLVAPSGKGTMLLSDVGGSISVSNCTLRFSTTANALLPDDGGLTSGLWLPTDFEEETSLSPPVPPGPYGKNFDLYQGMVPNGTWRLFIVDDYLSDDTGTLAGGWSLRLTTTNASCCVDPLSADLSVRGEVVPQSISLGTNAVCRFWVTNAGPALAANVFVTNTFATPVSIQDVSSSQGTATLDGSNIVVYLGAIPVGTEASFTVTVRVEAGPMLRATASVISDQPEFNPANNLVLLSSPVVVPSLFVSEVLVQEGDDDSNLAVFALTLSRPVDHPVQVECYTLDGTALSGADFVSTNRVVTFLPGDVVREFSVRIRGDQLDEDDEQFTLVLTNVVNAWAVRSNASATVIDDDPLPVLSVTGASVVEGDSGTNHANFVIALSAPSGRTIKVLAETYPGTATPGEDYLPLSQSLSIPPGMVETNVAVLIYGDTEIEQDESFGLRLLNPENAVLLVSNAVGVIATDDFGPLIPDPDFRITQESIAPPNGRIDAGETVTLSVAFQNTGSAEAKNLEVVLLPNSGVLDPSVAQAYGTLPPGGMVARPFTFTVGVSNCAPLELVFQVWSEGLDLGTRTLALNVGNCFTDDFEPEIDRSQWATLGSLVVATNHGGSVSGTNALWFGGSGDRYAVSRPVDCTVGGQVTFNLRLAEASASDLWEAPELPEEGVALEYSTNAGNSWVMLQVFDLPEYRVWTRIAADIPFHAQTPATQFRWRQLLHSGECCDHWAIDDVAVITGPQQPRILLQPVDRYAAEGGSVTFSVVAAGSSPLLFQWYFNQTNAIQGATGPQFTINQVLPSHSGEYSVQLANPYGTVASSNALLTVLSAGEIGEAVDAPDLAWVLGGTGYWTLQSLDTHDGVDAARSGVMPNGADSWIQTTVSGPGSISFWWKVSSEQGYDFLTFTIDNVWSSGISGEQNWSYVSNRVESGTHVLKWRYNKDQNVEAGQDCGWVDQVQFVPDSGAAEEPLLLGNGSLMAGQLRFAVLSKNNAPISPSRAATLQVQTRTDLNETWLILPHSYQFSTDGTLLIDVPVNPGEATRFFRLLEAR